MGMSLRRIVSRRHVLKIGAATGTALAGWASGLVPELVSAKSSGGAADPGRELSPGEVDAYLNTLHAPDADNFATHLASLGHHRLREATAGATRVLKGHVYVLIELGFSKVETTGASVYVIMDNSAVKNVSAVRYEPSPNGGKHAQELVIGTDGVVANGRAATLNPDGSMQLFEIDGTVKTATLADIAAADQTGRKAARLNPIGVITAEASSSCSNCELAGHFVQLFGCGIGVFLASLLCGPGFVICVLLVVLLAGTWCWAVTELGVLFTCCDLGYCNWCYDCDSC